MKKILYILVLFPLLTYAQVGINTTTPKAALDIESTNNGVLIPRVQLTSDLDNTTVINPNGGPLETSTLVYNIATAGVAPNAVIAGFYYWNGSKWISISGSATADHDWYEVGTTTTPNSITDDMFHTGNVAIGKNTADYPLEVNTTNYQFGINNIYNNPTLTNTQKATINNTITDNTNDEKYGIINNVSNNSATSGGIGVRNNVNGNGAVFYGNSNYLTSGATSTGADIIGVRNSINNGSNNTAIKGMYNIFDGTAGSTNSIKGVQNDFRVTALGKIGTYNSFDANTDGTNIGLFNALNSDSPSNNQIGISNEFNTGALTTGGNSGVVTQFFGSGSGAKTGYSIFISSSGDGEHTGTMQLINGSAAGTGTKYGTRTQIGSSAGGTHYGIHSTVLKPGATNFAGYFLGNVGIGTTTANTYTFPPSRGTNGQIMGTNGLGVLTWQNPSAFAWSLNGNAGTNPPTSIFGTPIAAGENFVGTTDNQDLVFGTNNLEKMRIKGFNIGIGQSNPTARIDMFDQGNAPSLRIDKISSSGDNTCIDISTRGIPSSLSGTKIASVFRALDGINNYAIVVPPNSGDVGFGTITPTTKLHIESPTSGALRIVDGTQAAGRVLTSNASGVATWQSIGTLGLNWSLNGNSAINTPAAPATYGTSTIGAGQNFLGTTNANDVTIATNSIERLRVKNTTGFVGVGTANPSTPFEVTSSGTTEFRLSSRGGFGTSRFSMISDKELATEWRPSFIESGDNGGFIGRMDFYTNGSGFANRFGVVRAMSIVNGNVGIGRTDPARRLDILAPGNSNGLRLLSGNNAEISYLSIGRVTDHAQIGSCTTGNFFLDALDGDMAIKNFNAGKILLGASVGANAAMAIIPGGNVGIGTVAPTNSLHINSSTAGALRLVDGTQGVNRVLTSDANGVATWSENSINNISGILGSGVNIPFGTGAYLQTNSYIDLPPGRWIINVAMLLRNTAASYTPNNSYFWLRTTFSESAGPSPSPTPDLSGSTLLSGNFMPSSVFSVIQGTLIINNVSAATKRYYYVAGNTQFNATSDILQLFGGNAFLENNIIAYRLN